MNPETPSTIPIALPEKINRLVDFMKSMQHCVVAYSGGVDSAVVAKIAALVLGERAKAVMAVSPSVAAGEVESAKKLAEEIGIDFHLIHTSEMEDPRYLKNDERRCYYCKQGLYLALKEFVREFPHTTIANGTNTDDLGDYRPGLEAARELRVVSPLVEAGLNKQNVRQLAKQWNLSVWDKPATPCLSSRIAYGESVTPERLRMVDQAETYLRSLGFRELRVRYHAGDLARIEIPQGEVSRFATLAEDKKIVNRFQDLGFRFVTLDLVGFRSGSLNSLVQITKSPL
ncbi:MAG: ATP-dependent sacrificial sulfur transferase LarE [Planctomycetota bacterium]|nr:ATP-dependent sacrificial sulfur transferase LarE [Planctomycetota bacterium]MEC8302188.1 ATP-dependent sacrificial sulfur transferase LarE [Planctomycetota bacterium]